MKNILIALCYSLVVSNQTVVQGQDSVAASHLSQYLASRPIERLYVHHDRSAYRAGETVWIKVYQAISPQAPEASQVAYIDLADSKGNIVSQAKLPLDDGTASGQFTLPDNLPTGEYSLCAYTRWMLNFPPEGIFRRTLTIYGHSPQNTPSSLSKEAKTGILLDHFTSQNRLFFPANNLQIASERVAFTLRKTCILFTKDLFFARKEQTHCGQRTNRCPQKGLQTENRGWR